MVELGLAPGFRAMAIGAFFTHLAFVYVVFGMAVVATTVGRLVFARQFKIGEPMVELVFVQPDYPGIGSLVVAMAGFTIQAAGILVFTMEALLVAYILGDRVMVMAVKA
jgi:hypothetical protein